MKPVGKHADWLDYKRKISAIFNNEPLEIRYDPPIVEVQVSEEEWGKIQKEAEFHCGIEESGGHAYNCNDCNNKCEEYYQWDKEIKDGNDD